MDNIEQRLKELLFKEDIGLLIKFHFGDGLDENLLNELYEILESIKRDWVLKKDIPKNIVFIIIDIVPSLYIDLPIYKGKEIYDIYEEQIYNLATAMVMVVNPNTDDSFFNKPLKELNI